MLLLLTEQQRREIRLCSFLETCLKSTSKGALFLYYTASTTKPSKAGIDITGIWKMGEGNRGQISTSVEGKNQLIIRTAQQWTGGIFAGVLQADAGGAPSRRMEEGTE